MDAASARLVDCLGDLVQAARLIFLTLHIMGVPAPSGGHPTWKASHSNLQRVVSLFFLTSSPKSLALILKSLNLYKKAHLQLSHYPKGIKIKMKYYKTNGNKTQIH